MPGLRDWFGVAGRLLPVFGKLLERGATWAGLAGLTAGGLIAFNSQHPLLGTTLLSACAVFLALGVAMNRQRELDRYEGLEKQAQERQSVRDQLATFIELGQDVQNRIKEDARNPSLSTGTATLPLCLVEAQNWADEVEEWLGRAMGHDYRKQFKVAPSMGLAITRPNPIPELAMNTGLHRQFWYGIEARMLRLTQFLTEVRSGQWTPPTTD